MQLPVHSHPSLHFSDHGMPATDLLLMGRYEMSTARERVWYEFEDHLDLPEKMGLNKYMASQSRENQVFSTEFRAPTHPTLASFMSQSRAHQKHAKNQVCDTEFRTSRTCEH